MRHFLKDGTVVLKIGHRISADNRTYMTIAKCMDNSPEEGHHIKSKDYNMFLGHFSVSGERLVHDQDQEITFILDDRVVGQISKNTGLTFELEIGAGGKVCFANSPELRDDFKIVFSPWDVLDYSYGTLHSLANRTNYETPQTDFLHLPYPKETTTFWKMVESGRKIRKT